MTRLIHRLTVQSGSSQTKTGCSSKTTKHETAIWIGFQRAYLKAETTQHSSVIKVKCSETSRHSALCLQTWAPEPPSCPATYF